VESPRFLHLVFFTSALRERNKRNREIFVNRQAVRSMWAQISSYFVIGAFIYYNLRRLYETRTFLEVSN